MIFSRCRICTMLMVFLVLSCSEDGDFVIPDPVPTAAISLDRSFYVGYSSAAKVMLVDNDNANTTAVVQVISDSDYTGIPLMLSNTGTNFFGLLQFTNTTSVSNSTIQISAGDEVRLYYQEPYPQGIRIKQVQWFKHIGYNIHNGFYYGTIPPGMGWNIGFVENIGEPGFSGDEFGLTAIVSSNTYMDTAYPATADEAEQYKLRNASFFIFHTYPVNLGIFSPGYLCLGISATNNLEIELVSGSGDVGPVVQLQDYITLDNSYHFIRIPLSDFPGLDMNFFSKFVIRNRKGKLVHFILDGVYFEL